MFFDEDIEDFVKNHSNLYQESFKKGFREGFQRGEKKGIIFTLRDKGFSMRETAMYLTGYTSMNFSQSMELVEKYWNG